MIFQSSLTIPSSRSTVRGSPIYCAACGLLDYGSKTWCRRCGSYRPQSVSTVGTVYSYTVVERLADQPQAKSYVLALVRLSGGPMVMGQMVDADPKNLSVGLRVELLRRSDQDAPSAAAGRLLFTPITEH